jgi:hypothetical protein
MVAQQLGDRIPWDQVRRAAEREINRRHFEMRMHSVVGISRLFIL